MSASRSGEVRAARPSTPSSAYSARLRSAELSMGASIAVTPGQLSSGSGDITADEPSGSGPCPIASPGRTVVPTGFPLRGATMPTYDDLSALFVNCTLKRSPEVSNTEGLIDVSRKIMLKQGVRVDEFRAVDHDIATGVW